MTSRCDNASFPLLALAMAVLAVARQAHGFSSCLPMASRAPLVTPGTSVMEPMALRSSTMALCASADDDASASPSGDDAKKDDDDEDTPDKTESPEASDSTSEKPLTEAEKFRQKARELREEIQALEAEMPDTPIDPERAKAFAQAQEAAKEAAAKQAAARGRRFATDGNPVSLLDGKNVLVVGSNGRLGSMVCRRLLRQYPEIANVVAMVHVVFENSETARGYGRLSYEVGAEDGRGSIGPAWSADDRVATFEFDEEVMAPYNLQKLRVVECEVLDPVQCQTIVEDAQPDVIVWCATDFDGSTPRAISGGSGPLSNLPFAYRAVRSPDKGRVEVEGLQNMLGALKIFKQESIQRNRQLAAFGGRGGDAASESSDEQPLDIEKAKDDASRGVDFLLVSSTPDALGNFETPFGSFLDIKRQGEDMIPEQFPSFKYSVLQFATYEDNFVKEDLELKLMEVVNEAPRVVPDRENDGPPPSMGFGGGMGLFASLTRDDSQVPPRPQEPAEPQKRQRKVRRINRRDAARAVGEALVDPDYHNKKVQVWTNEVG